MDFESFFLTNWPVKLVCVILIVAAWIDGKQLKVPNWITFPMVLTGIAYNTWINGWSGLGESLLGMVVGLACLLPLYSVGGMGAGDVKLMGGIGAWLGVSVTWWAFVVSTVVGAVMAVLMVLYKRAFVKHWANAMQILHEWKTIKNPEKLAEIAAQRKPTMFLLPYGIPICIGSIAYFCYAGMIY